jgi:hypothetical protein
MKGPRSHIKEKQPRFAYVKNDVTITRVEDTVLEKRKEKGGKESKR